MQNPGRLTLLQAGGGTWGILEKYPRATFAVQDRSGHFLGVAEQRKLAGDLIDEWLGRVEPEKANGQKMVELG